MNKQIFLIAIISAATLLSGCPSDPVSPGTDAARGDTGPIVMVDMGPRPDMGPLPDANLPDTGVPPVDANMGVTNDCAGYCMAITTACTGDNAQYIDSADCLAQCAAMSVPAGTPGATGGNTIACRIYHAGAAVTMGAGVHCPHAGATGSGVCVGATPIFRTNPLTAYTRIDRMGMPAVSTAAVPTDSKDLYNDGGPMDDASLSYAGPLLAQLTAVHGLLDADLVTLGLVPCSMTMTTVVPGVGPLPNCVAQQYAVGHPVVTLVVPDTLTIDPAAMAGFPNGRRLPDPVIDVTLAVVLLDLTATGQNAGTLAGLPLNPMANDVAFLTTFPYLAPAH